MQGFEIVGLKGDRLLIEHQRFTQSSLLMPQVGLCELGGDPNARDRSLNGTDDSFETPSPPKGQIKGNNP
jgi:hypothetical protein